MFILVGNQNGTSNERLIKTAPLAAEWGKLFLPLIMIQRGDFTSKNQTLLMKAPWLRTDPSLSWTILKSLSIEVISLVLTYLGMSITDEEKKRIDTEKEELRKRRQRTEFQVAKIAKENPEMLDLKAKEILERLDKEKLKKNNQLESLDLGSKVFPS